MLLLPYPYSDLLLLLSFANTQVGGSGPLTKVGAIRLFFASCPSSLASCSASRLTEVWLGCAGNEACMELVALTCGVIGGVGAMKVGGNGVL